MMKHMTKSRIRTMIKIFMIFALTTVATLALMSSLGIPWRTPVVLGGFIGGLVVCMCLFKDLGD